MISINEFVDREVVYNCSSLISGLVETDTGKWFDELMSICRQEDYKTAALEDGWTVMERSDGIKVIMKGEFIYDPQSNVVDQLDQVVSIDYEDYEIDDEDDQDIWEALCEYERIDPYNQALEHWIVSDWLADKLLEHNEMISKDIYGLTVWGRCCTGQAIAADYVIQQIYQETI